MTENCTSHSEEETMEIGRKLGERVGPGDVIGLWGDLGAGKTQFVKGFAGAFGISPGTVSSPTFNLIQEYKGSRGIDIFHFDCYRLESAREALEIGSGEYFYGDGVSIIEWPERISEILPPDMIDVRFTVNGKNSRKIEIEYPDEK